jgi:glycosyltransferase involved in cell wall biosynthesis
MSNIVIYNLETDKDSIVLAAGHDWILEFAKFASEIVVFSTHVGKTELPGNVRVIELGGGDFWKRLKALWIIYKALPSILCARKNLIVFHHMSPRTLLILGPIYRVFRVPQGLWYSHSVKSFSLKMSRKLANRIFSSTTSTLPYKDKNCKAVGHGIAIAKFSSQFKISKLNRGGIVALGRVAPIKNIDLAIKALAGLEESYRVLNCVGPYDTSNKYVEDLKNLSIKHGVQLHLSGSENYSAIPKILCEFSMIFTGTPISVDKAVIEGAICGCFVVTTSKEAQELTGMSEIWRELGFNGALLSVESQIKILLGIAPEREAIMRIKLSAISISKNSIENTARKIIGELAR